MPTNAFGDPIDTGSTAAVNAFGDPIEGGYKDAPTDQPRVEVRGTSASKPTLRETLMDAARSAGSGFAHGSQDVGAGILAGGGRLANVLTAPLDLAADAVTGKPLGTGNRERGEAIEAVTRPLAHDPDSISYGVARAVPEMAATAGPLAGVTNAVAQGARTMLPKALQRFAPAAADIGVNTLYEGSKAGLQGTDVGEASRVGAEGSAIGHGVGGFIAHGVKPMLNAGARRLAEAGIDLTPGQMLGAPGRAIEGAAQSLPFTGAIDRAQARGMGQYSRAEVNEALKPLEVSTSKIGEDAVAHGKQIVGDAYRRVLPDLSMPATSTQQALMKADQAVIQIPRLDRSQYAHLTDYVNRRIPTQRDMTGDEWKSLDSELGDLAHKFRTSSDPTHGPVGDAYKEIQRQLRDAVVPRTAGAKEHLGRINAARSRLYPIEDAADKAVGKMGAFSPTQMAQARVRAGVPLTDLDRSGRELLTDKRPLARTLSRLGLPTAGGAVAAGAHALGLPGAGTAAAVGAGTAVAGGLASNLLYNPGALRFVLHGLSMSPHGFSGSAKMLADMPPERAASEIQRLVTTYPSFAQAVSQLGRSYAAQQGAQ